MLPETNTCRLQSLCTNCRHIGRKNRRLNASKSVWYYFHICPDRSVYSMAHGITEEDLERMARYLEKNFREREPDILLPTDIDPTDEESEPLDDRTD